jgi:hypothetical protein
MDVYDSPKVFDVTTADGAKQVGSDKTDTTAVINDDNLRLITLTATLSADGTSLALNNSIYSGNSTLLGSASGTDTTLNDSTFTFNEVAIGFNGTLPAGGVDYRIDNVNVIYTPAPEPACVGLLAMIPLAVRRRLRA